MSWTCLGQNDVVTRKVHECFGCAHKFPPKSSMLKRDGVEDGQVYHMYICPVCAAFEHKTKDIWDDDVGFGDFPEFEGYKQFKEQFLNQIYG